ncbi:3-deoxy-D-manno-octulosonic acid transferase [Oceanicaulis sp. MMSF_3324]|uniref:3-deoxy-D-manno-octulosonic acid transferase n=1 Tax=Oceanicaulis sp. MMSF_3324 TaxID=3046702 RepID=UPI00273F2645|nr:glycosyltransferase N-terminal domain-containing protein [Oceanicaulis sp. MMSF_3324]
MSAPGLSLYRFAAKALKPAARWLLDKRARDGKEDPARLHERQGEAQTPRPEGRLIWIHAASVGESQMALTVAEAILNQHDDAHVLITSGTLTSARLIARRGLARLIHQFPPVDAPDWVSAFLDHWTPDLAVFTESELWPNLILAAKERGVPLALMNARMNRKSLNGWARWPSSARTLLGAFDWIGAADQRTAEGLSTLTGHPVETIGNLKLECGLPAPDPVALEAARSVIGDRPVFVAASTHEGEEALIAAAHAEILKPRPDALMILAPRHPERAEDVSKVLTDHALGFAQRSKGETPEGQPVWLADTLGEMALWYALCPVAVIAGSFKPGIGGHNPIEASRAGALVVTGPHVDSFSDVYGVYDAHEARLIAQTATEIADHVLGCWQEGRLKPDAALDALNALPNGALPLTLSHLNRLLDQGRP